MYNKIVHTKAQDPQHIKTSVSTAREKKWEEWDSNMKLRDISYYIYKKKKQNSCS